MNPLVGWLLAGTALVAGWTLYGWQGLAFAATLIGFWLVLQFNRTVRVMRNAGSSPVGHVASAVMLQAKLRAGMPMLDVVALTKSLGRKVDAAGDVFAWADDGGAEVVVTFADGRCRRWQLNRPAGDAE